MEQAYEILGMHCESCTKKIKTALEADENIISAKVTLKPSKAALNLKKNLTDQSINELLSSAGEYKLKNKSTTNQKSLEDEKKESIYPLYLIVIYILITVTTPALSSNNFNISWLMHKFMAGFFIVFSFFKLLDLNGFASAFRGYDLLAKRFKVYGFTYPFIELILGITFLTEVFLPYAYILTIIIMGFGSIGVLQSLLKKNTIQCACLGTVLNLPMTKITLIENLTMVVMALVMLLNN